MPTHLSGKHKLFDEIHIFSGTEDVWAVLSDFCAVHTWAPQVTHSGPLDAPERGPGAARHCTIEGFGRIEEFVVDWQEGRSFTYRVSAVGPLGESVNRWTVEPAGIGRSTVRVDFAYDTRFGPIGALLNALMMRGKLRRALSAALDALKRRVETGQSIRPKQLAAAAAA